MTEMSNGTPLHLNGVSEDNKDIHHDNNGYTTPSSQPDPPTVASTTDRDPSPTVPKENAEVVESQPSKKRKLTDSEVRKAAGQRPISPPWKRITVEGPTSFVEEGRRKSSRTNFVPIDLQPHQDKRRTRGAASHTAPVIQSKYGGASVLKPSLTPNSSDSSVTVKKTRPIGKPAPPTPKSSQNSTARSLQSSPLKNASQATAPAKRPYNKKTQPPPQPNSDAHKPTDTQQPPKRKVGRPPSKSKMADQANNLSATEPHTSDPRTRPRVEGLRPSSDYKPQRLNLRFRAPTLGVQHPGHMVSRQMYEEKDGDTLVKKPKYASFEDWLEREGNGGLEAGESDPRLTDEEAFREASLRNRIAEAARPGGLLSEQRCTFHKPEGSEEPQRLFTHQDRLNAHARYFQKLMAQERTKHLRAAKECAERAAAFVKHREQQAYQKWKQVQPKTEEEIRREQDELFKAIYVQLKEDIKRKWLMVTEIAEERRHQRWEEEQERLGNQALNEVIENARGSLNKRRKHLSEMESNENSDEEAEGDDSDDEQPESDSEDESNMSASQSESEDDAQALSDNDDAGLTVEQLRQKYAAKAGPDAIDDSGAEINDAETLQAHSTESVPRSPGKLEVSLDSGSHGESPPAIQDGASEVPINGVSDESDHSTDMEDDEDMSDDDESEDASASDVSSEDGYTGLLGFYGKKAVQQQIEQAEREASADKAHVPNNKSEKPSPITDATKEDTSETPAPKQSPSEVDVPSQPLGEADFDQPKVSVSQDNGLPTADRQISPPPQQEDTNMNEQPQTSLAHDASTAITTPVPSLLRGTLRKYQHFGLEWLAKLYANGDHGILADEMGLGKTIQTIALLAHLAVHYEIWGPHLIIVPTSVMLNWEMEFKKFLPGFKILTYYGTLEERKRKRQGMTDGDKWNVWITSYQLVVNDQQVFKRKAWHYMVLDEAHNIKNFRSMRWQALLTVRTHSRLLLTGTPLQNNLSELWSLLFFLQPEKFLDLEEFNNHFKRPESQILENGRDAMNSQSREMVTKLHEVLRPSLLRRLKADVEKQLPGKYEHVVYCRLSKRQRHLYDGFMSRAQTRESLASGNTFSIMNALMQLRKVCNHPDLFETHSIKTSFAMPKSAVSDFEIKELLVRRRLLREELTDKVDLDLINLVPGSNERLSALDTIQRQRLGALGTLRQLASQQWQRIKHSMEYDGTSVEGSLDYLKNCTRKDRFEELRHHAYLTSLRSQRRPLYSHSLTERLRIRDKILPYPPMPKKRAVLSEWFTQTSPAICDIVKTLPDRSQSFETTIAKFACITPKVVATDMVPLTLTPKGVQTMGEARALHPQDPFHEARVRLSIAFPDKRLLQYDCGKLQRLDALLRDLQSGGHRALIFTQMTKVLDILEQFLNIHGHRYLRLDGATKVDQRQALTERFNNDSRILAFILSSRSGGIGINLTGADTVIFYDMDWNPAMDKQCQDRCHRIGQTRDVHIYRLISENTIEANILRKANQKRMLDDVVIQEGDFTTDYFNMTTKELIGEDQYDEKDADANAAMDRILGVRGNGKIFEQVEDVEDIQAAKLAEHEIAQNTDAADFDEKGASSNSAGSNTPRTPATPSELMPPPPPPHMSKRNLTGTGSDVERTATMDALDSGLASASIHAAAAADLEDNDNNLENETPSCDEFMIRFLEWELRDVPVQAAEELKRRKKAKKGKEHIVRKRQ